MVKRIPMPGKESPQRAVDDKRDNSRVPPSGRGKAAYGGYSQGGESPRSAATAGSDGGKYSQPQLKGAAKVTQRRAENALTNSDAMRNPSSKQIPYTPTPVAGCVPPRGNQGNMQSGMDKAMSDHADALHPVKQGRIADNRKSSPKMTSY